MMRSSYNHRRNIKETDIMLDNQALNHLIHFLKAGVSPYHTVSHAADTLDAAGFQALDFKAPWALEKGKSYYCRTFSGELFAFRIGTHAVLENGVRIAAGHVDWPCLRIKPAPTFSKQGYLQANVEVYGGPILSTFFDRPLSIAGKITLRSQDILHPEVRYIDLKKPVCIVPNLAIHMNRQVNDGVAIDKQLHMMPVLGMIQEQLNEHDRLLEYIAAHENVAYDDILDYELCLYNMDEPAFVGLSDEFLSAPRLDDTTAVSAIVHGLIDSTPDDVISLGALFDNEEVGSHTKQGADALMLNFVLEKIWAAFGKSGHECYADLAGSMILSIDVGHGYHPNYPSTFDITTLPVLGSGFVIKTDSNQKYAWDSEAVGALLQLCQHAHIPCQRFAKRSNVAGGGTIASLISAHIPVKTVDMGVPLLSMHSARELMGAADQEALENAVRSFMSL